MACSLFPIDRRRADYRHLLGVTSVEPPAYYHRTLKNPRVDPAQGALWSPWRKLNVQIPVRRAAPVVYLGRLHVFWIEVRTQSVNKIQSGASTFVGYRHKLTLKYTFMRLDGQWAAPQEVNLPVMKEGGGAAGVVTDYFTNMEMVVDKTYNEVPIAFHFEYVQKPRLDPEHEHKEPIDSYTLSGPNWEEVFLQPIGSSMLRLVTRNFRLNIDVDLFNRTTKMIGDVTPAPPAVAPSPNIQLLHARNPDKGKSLSLYSGWATHWYTKSRNAFANLVLDRRRIETFDWEYGWGKDEVPIKEELYGSAIPIMEVPRGSKLLAISGSIGDVIVQAEREAFLIQYCVPGFSLNYTLRRAGTSHATNFAQTLFMQGIDGLLDTHHQETLEETHTIAGSFDDRATKTKSLDFDGPYGVYYREIFFHIPHIVADHLNSQGQFAAAQRWYHYVFNPTADAVNDSEGAGRMWRYREFRHPSVETLRQILMNGAAISAYRQDPFNPHAIARLRPSAYQKSVVMKYIDNLLDWGDSLFSEFTMESVNEATMLYTMAADILGERPYEVGDCGEPSEEVTYEQLEPSLSAELPFLIELESYVTGSYSALNSKSSAKVAKASPEGALHRLAPEIIDDAIRKSLPGKADPGAGVTEEKSPSGGSAPSGRWWTHTTAAGWTTGKGARRNGDKSSQPLIDHGMKLADSALAPSVGQSILRQVGPVFCVPVNKELLAYWDRVEDRLYKIHNCLDIHGVRRDLALFAPEIDPRLLVKMKAEGLTLDEVWSVTSGDLPPYRFLYLVEKAKAFASTLRELGNALLAALEKKDSEELGRLRLTHEQNLAKMSTQLRKWEIDAAEEAQKQAQQQKEAAELRRDYYRGLIDQDLTRWEQTEQTARKAASRFKIEATLFSMAAAISYLVPQIGSPFAMKFGGKELGDSFSSFASVLHGAASVAEAEASSTGAEAHFDRRRTDWKHQRDLADRDVKQLERQIKAAEIRKQIAEKSLEIHEKTMEQTEEVYAFYADKLTSFGLYTWMATTLQRGYREAYSNALAIARQCEVAFRFERDEELDVPVGTGAWDASRAGLLAGEQLLLDLQRLERRFIETNYRTLEVEQSFALTQIDPAALYKLRETGECVFEIPEVFFDLAYPGHYRRRIKAVRLTIPCVTGPYTNVGATLTLQGSQVRVNAHDATLKVVPPQGTVSIATSRAQNDAGVFELSFHDERYVPFEGAGAVSSWKLTLPKSFRPFDYDTISDVVVTIAYTALADSVLRTKVEALSAQAEGAILKVLSQPQNALVRVISLRQELPMAYKALLHSPVGTEVGFEIQDWHFPAFVSANGRKMVVTETRVALKTAEGVSIDGVELVVDGDTVEGFVVDGDLGGLPSKKLDSTKVFTKAVKKVHKVAVSAAGGLGSAPQSGDFAALDAEKLLDILVYVRFNVA